MESHVKFMGHPIHPMLIVLPLGLFIGAVVFDIIFLVTGNTVFSIIAYWNIAAGIIGGLLAAIAGFLDWLNVPSGSRAKTVGAFHGAGNVFVVALFAISWFIRAGSIDYGPTTGALILSFGAILLGTLTAWLGGELVDRLGVGVDRGANVNAPNSLSGRPATSTLESGVPQGNHDLRAGIPVTGQRKPESEENKPEHREER